MLGSDLSMEDGLIFRNTDLFEETHDDSSLSRPQDMSLRSGYTAHTFDESDPLEPTNLFLCTNEGL